MFNRFVIALVLLGLLSACPAMSPVGSPSNPAGVANPEKTDAAEPESPSTAADLPADATNRSLPGPSSGAGGDSPAIPISNPITNPPSGGSPNIGDSYAIAQGGTYCPKGDNELMGEDRLAKATDWRLRFGVNAWWELSRTVPEPYPLFKNQPTADFQMKLEALTADCGWLLVIPGLKVTLIHGNQSFEALSTDLKPEGYNLAFSGIPLAEGTVVLSVEYNGVPHALGTLKTYYSPLDGTFQYAPFSTQSK